VCRVPAGISAIANGWIAGYAIAPNPAELQ
jgi:hypothetical protein